MSIKIIAEIGINHSGSIKVAEALIDMAKDCGADYVKFQKRTISEVYTEEFLDQPRESPWGRTQRDQKHGLEFGTREYREIDRHCKKVGIPWFASCWDLASLQFIDNFDVPMHKIASPMLTNLDFVEAVAATGRHTLISTGMSDLCDISRAVSKFEDFAFSNPEYGPRPKYSLLHCVGEYPCPPDRTNLAMIRTLKERYPGIEVGFSSHAVSPVIPAFAVLMGAEIIEAHITLDRAMYGSDQAASLERPGLQKLVDYCRMAEESKGLGIKTITEAEAVNAKKMRYWE